MFAHPHAQIHGDVMEKGRNVTDGVREEQKHSSSTFSSSFTFLIFLKPGKKDLLSNQETEKEDLKNSGRQWQPTKYHSHWSEVHRTEVGILLTFLTLTLD